ncbi:DUF397 domain-containing protein [Streptomyces sp. NPDC087658]|uniref:DUF397 domain-containing protein n=1 Tax=Streptomyces sp. NPDC087658 TaxID=3365800 RepID=UPI0037F15051
MQAEIKWQKSSFSDPGGQCIEVAEHGGGLLVRESDDPNVITTTSRARFAALTAGIKSGLFNRFTS